MDTPLARIAPQHIGQGSLHARNVELVPAAAIFVAVLGFNMLGDGLRDVLEPQSRA